MVFLRSEARHIGFRTVRKRPVAGDRVVWDGEGWYYSRPAEVVNRYGSTVRKVCLWRRQVGPHAIGVNLRHFDELSRLLAWPRERMDANGNVVEGVFVTPTRDWEIHRSPQVLWEHEMVSAYLGESWNRPHRVEREFIPVTEITEPEPFVWPAWADEE